MINNTFSKKILVIENDEANYEDIIECLPLTFIAVYKPSIDEEVIEEIKNSDYVLCISDLLDIDSIANGYPSDSTEVFASFKRGIKRISKLRQHLKCNLIIVTKIPVRHLRDHFDKMINDPEIQILFADDRMKLCRKLDDSKSLPFGVVYTNEKIHIMLKPYLASGKKDVTTEQWKNEFSIFLRNMLINET